MSTLRTTTLKHGGSTILDNLVLSNAGETRFCPNSSFGRAALYVDGQTNRVGVNTETPGVALDVDGALNATGNVAIGGTLSVTGLLTSNGNLLVNGTLNVTNTGTFGNNVSSVGYFGAGGNPSGGIADGSRIYAGGGCTVSTGTATNQIWRGYTTSNSTATSSIRANGEATFEGNMLISRVDPGSDVFLRIKNETGTDTGTTCSLRLSTSPGAFDTSVLQADRTTGSTSFYYGTTRTLQLTSAGALKTGAGLYDTKASDGGIDAGSGLYSLLFGGNSGGGANQNQARIDGGNKEGRVVLCHKDNAEEPVGAIVGFSQGTSNKLYVGGGSSLVNAATEIVFYTATNNTTTGGLQRVRIDETGNMFIGGDDGYLVAEYADSINNGENLTITFAGASNTQRGQNIFQITYCNHTNNSANLFAASFIVNIRDSATTGYSLAITDFQSIYNVNSTVGAIGDLTFVNNNNGTATLALPNKVGSGGNSGNTIARVTIQRLSTGYGSGMYPTQAVAV